MPSYNTTFDAGLRRNFMDLLWSACGEGAFCGYYLDCRDEMQFGQGALKFVTVENLWPCSGS